MSQTSKTPAPVQLGSREPPTPLTPVSKRIMVLVDSDRLGELFNDGWRDPTDSAERMMVLVLMAIGTLGGGGLAGYAVALLSHRVKDDSVKGPGTALFFLVMGAGIFMGCVAFFWKEKKHWDLKHLTAERVVAGIFVLGFAFFMLGFEFIGAQHGIHENPLPAAALTWVAGATVCLFGLIVGLLCAGWDAFKDRPKRLRATVTKRYAVNAALDEIEDAGSPEQNGWTPVVELRTSDGQCLRVRPVDWVYGVCEPGTTGVFTLRGRHAVAFRRE